MNRTRPSTTVFTLSILLLFAISNGETILNNATEGKLVSAFSKKGRVHSENVLGNSRDVNYQQAPGDSCDDISNFCSSNICLSDNTCDCAVDENVCGAESDCCAGFNCVSGTCVRSTTCSTAVCYNNDNYECCGDSVCIDASCQACRKASETCNEDDECCGTNVCKAGACATDESLEVDEKAPVNTTTLADSDATKNSTTSKDSCFPDIALVTLVDGTEKMMSQLEIGDQVLTTNGKYSSVFMFTHKIASEKNVFVELQTELGPKIALTHGHYLKVNGEMQRASSVKVGDALYLADGSESRVSSVSEKVMNGLYNPQTVDGNIVVDGIIASTYTEAVEMNMAHSLLSPLRALYNVFGLSITSFESGSEIFA